MKPNVDAFAKLHLPGDPLVLYNIWDPGSAKAVAEAGAKAIATGSWGVACAMGFGDGEKLPLDMAMDNLLRIVGVTDLPVTLDMEAGYSETAEGVATNVQLAADAGAVGINLEDKNPVTRELFSVAEASARIASAATTGLFINARADLFIVTPADGHDAALADQVLERAKAYADAGANGLFVPFVRDKGLIARLCEHSPLPVNILVAEDFRDYQSLANVGVARVSHGHGPWAAAMDWIKGRASEIYGVKP